MVKGMSLMMLALPLRLTAVFSDWPLSNSRCTLHGLLAWEPDDALVYRILSS